MKHLLDGRRRALIKLELRERKTFMQKVVREAKRLHDSNEFQSFFGVCIMLSFIISLVKAEMVRVF